MAKEKVKKKKKKSIVKMINPFTLFGKRKVLTFVFTVVAITSAIVAYLIIDLYQLRREIDINSRKVRTFSESEYQALLSTPTIVDYIFPDDPTNIQAMIRPWRSWQEGSAMDDRVAKLWLDLKSLELENLPDLSRQNLVDYIAELRANDPNF